jgi:hypothetical protein
MVISGGGFNDFTIGSMKRKFIELISAFSKFSYALDITKGGSVPLSETGKHGKL